MKPNTFQIDRDLWFNFSGTPVLIRHIGDGVCLSVGEKDAPQYSEVVYADENDEILELWNEGVWQFHECWLMALAAFQTYWKINDEPNS